MNLLVREDVLSARSISLLGKLLLSYFAAMYYYNGERITLRIDYIADKLGVKWEKVDDEIEVLSEKKLITPTYLKNGKSVEILLDRNINIRFPGLLKRKSEEEPTTGLT